jgi:hypothetical protein
MINQRTFIPSLHNKLKNRLLFSLLGMFLLALVPLAQGQGLGHIVGAVTDSTGAAIPAAHVTATQISTGATSEATSNGGGEYVFSSLSPSTYSIRVTAPGFSAFLQKSVVLLADQSVTVNASLTPGGVTDTVVVNADTSQVDTTTGTLSQVIGERQVNDLPLNGRNAASLTTLVAGVVAAPSGSSDQGNTKTFPVVVNVSVNGTRANQTSYLLDGGNNVDEYTNVNAPFPFPDALQEFSVQTSNYAAEYGQNAGGVVNVITKSGGSMYHGDLFEYVRNAVFNARSYFQSTVDPLKRNQFGGTFGGPVGIPDLWKTKKTFFFAGYQKTITRTQAAATSSSIIPTTANANGFFSGKVTNPATGQPFPYNAATNTTTISPSLFDKASVALLNYLPVANGNGLYNFQKPTAQDFDEGVGRFDQELGAHDRYTLRYYLNEFNNVGVLNLKNLTTYADESHILYQNALISETHTFSDSVLNNFILSYQREGSTRGPLGGSIDANDLGINIWQPAFKSIQSIAVSGFFSIGDNPYATFARANITLADDLHWVKGSHNVAFGFHGELSKIDVVNQNGQPGTFSFNATNTNNALASFFLGYLYEFKQNSGQFQQDRGKFLGGYVQDNWKLSRRLTLDYGLRYEPFLPLHEAGGRMGQFNPTAYASNTRSVVYPNAPAGLLFPGDPGVPTDGVRPVYKNFMPRVGFAWDVFGTGKTSVRGGGGLFYDTRTDGLFNNGWIGSTPFTTSVDLIQAGGTFSNPYGNTTNPFPATFPPPKNTPFLLPFAAITFDPSGNFKVPLTYAWNIAVEQQLAGGFSSRIAYVGVHASHVFTSPELNPARYIPGSTLSTNARRIYQNFTTISDSDMGGNSSYNSLQATLQRRFTHGLSVMANYTWSKSIDNVPYGTAVTSAGAGISYSLPVYLPNYKRLDIGPSDFDHRNVFTASYVWQIPRWNGGDALARTLVNGWQTSGLVSSQSGDALTLYTGQDNSLTGLNRDVPNLVGYTNPRAPGACAGFTGACKDWLMPSAFAVPATGQDGDVKKGSFVGPRYVDWDAGLFRNIDVTERAFFQFRAEYFNLLNHTNFSDPGTTVTSTATFGRITTSNTPRIAQLSLKLTF